MEKEKSSSGTIWESQVGYSRAVRKGKHIFISGTTATDEDGNIIGKEDPYRQTMQAINNIEKTLKELGASLNDVVRTRIYVRNMDQWKEIGRAHSVFFGEIRPAATMIEVNRFVDPDMLVEIEADAIIS